MATHDYIVSNGTGSVIRADINNALSAIVSNNSSSSEPATKYAYMWWADTSAGLLKIRNSANDAWITLFQLDGTLTLEDGSNSAPAISFRDDTNTGIFSSAADNLDITTGGTTRVNVSSAGINVTGTVTDDGASHDGDVTFTGASANIIFDKSDNALEFADNAKAIFGNSGDLEIFHDASDSVINDAGTGSLKLQLGGATKAEVVSGGFTVTGDLTIDTNTLHVDSSNDRVGIGTTSPSSLLHVSGTGIPTIKLEDTDTAGGYAHFEVNGSALFIESYDEDGTTGQILFKNASTEAMRISESGHLGIGTTSPAYPLEVRTASGDANFRLMTSGTGAGDDTVLRSQIGGTSGSNYIYFGDDDDVNAGQIRYSHASDYMSFTANAAERMRILSSGGITFNGDTATANALDDYEEGVFTPSLEFGGATTGITYSSMRGGSYVKIGRQVTVNFGFTLTSKGSASGDATIAGLPYAVEDLLSATSVEASGVSSFWNDVATDSANIVFAALGGTSELELRNTVGAEDDTDAMVDSDFDNDSAIRGSITYFTAT